MKQATGVARITTAEGRPAVGLDLRMQTFSLRTARWQNVASGKTDREGRVTLSGALAEDDDDSAPQLRLVKAAGNAVLSEGGRLTYDRAKQELSVEFGDLVDLGETIATEAIDPRFARITHNLGGGQAALNAMRARGGRTVIGAGGGRDGGIEDLRPQLTALNLQLGEKDSQITRLQADLTEQTKAARLLETKVARLPQLEAQIAGFRDLERDLKLDRARIVDLQRQLDKARAENEELRAPKEQVVSTQALAENLGRQIRGAQSAIEAGGGLALANVRVRLKGVVKDGAQSVELLGKDELSAGGVTGGLAEFDFEFGRDGEASAVTEVVVPDLRTLTEGAVRQALAAIGLRLEPVVGPAGQGVAAGQAALQVPAAGTRAARGSAVTVVFAS